MPPAADRPNIVVIQADQLAAAALGAYGNTVVKSPHLDALAAGGLTFDRAYCNSPLCAPSRASMMTGLLPSQIGAYDNGADFPASVPTFAHHLRSAGYATTLVGRMHFIGPDQLHGFEERLTTDVYPAGLDMVPDWDLPGEERLAWYHDAGSVFTAGTSRATVQQDFDDEVLFRTLRHLNDRARADDGRPFLLVSSFIHPHDPYEPPVEHWNRYEGVEIDGPRVTAEQVGEADPHSTRLQQMSGFDVKVPDEDQVRRARRAYYACVSYVDDHVGAIVRRLDELGLRENTVIIVTSDHGDMLGERGLWYKMSPFEQSARVPLIVNAPERFAPRRVADPVSLIDVLPTLVELAGAPQVDGPGRSLVTTVAEDAPQRPLLIEYLAEGTTRPQVTVVRGHHKYVRCPGDPDQLYDVRADPDELVNLADDPAHAGIVGELRAEIAARYDLTALERDVRQSQARRRVVHRALASGRPTEWDHQPPVRPDYVRGDFWSALERGRIAGPEGDRPTATATRASGS
ncbi:choline-sulfatase [Aeromicrobium alkaliterrae]|uniref:Choline-sulfatase n=1 Tax=Aeromicrobium alkaliterrae TaxID=302168 RepID=A0ABP4VU95_9ACTN